MSENEKLKKQINRLEKATKQITVWAQKSEKSKFNTRNSGLKPDRGFIEHKSAKMMKRAKNTKKEKN